MRAATLTRRSLMGRSFVATVLSGILAFQLALAGLGATCVMPTSDGSMSTAGLASGAMAGMAMPGANGPDASRSDRVPGSDRGPSTPCNQPGNPASCQVMSPCAAAFIAAAAPRTDAATVAPITIRSVRVLAPPSRTTAPELPPPRA